MQYEEITLNHLFRHQDFHEKEISKIEIQDKVSEIKKKVNKKEPRLKDVYLVLHTSLSGVFNTNMVKKVGANEFLAKFAPDDLAMTVQKRIKAFQEQRQE